MNFSISGSISPNDFNNQHFIILARILILFAWKLFSLDSFRHLGHFGEDKTISILFAPLNKYKKLCKINISYGSLKIKQYSEVTYLGCILDESLSGESMALNVASKINTLLNKFLSPQLRRLLCNALIQPHFEDGYSIWYSNLNRKSQNKVTNSSKQMCMFLPSTRY